MDDFYKIILKIKHVLHASPLSKEEFWVLITLDNYQILVNWHSRFGGIEI